MSRHGRRRRRGGHAAACRRCEHGCPRIRRSSWPRIPVWRTPKSIGLPSTVVVGDFDSVDPAALARAGRRRRGGRAASRRQGQDRPRARARCRRRRRAATRRRTWSSRAWAAGSTTRSPTSCSSRRPRTCTLRSRPTWTIGTSPWSATARSSRRCRVGWSRCCPSVVTPSVWSTGSLRYPLRSETSPAGPLGSQQHRGSPTVTWASTPESSSLCASGQIRSTAFLNEQAWTSPQTSSLPTTPTPCSRGSTTSSATRSGSRSSRAPCRRPRDEATEARRGRSICAAGSGRCRGRSGCGWCAPPRRTASGVVRTRGARRAGPLRVGAAREVEPADGGSKFVDAPPLRRASVGTARRAPVARRDRFLQRPTARVAQSRVAQASQRPSRRSSVAAGRSRRARLASVITSSTGPWAMTALAHQQRVGERRRDLLDVVRDHHHRRRRRIARERRRAWPTSSSRPTEVERGGGLVEQHDARGRSSASARAAPAGVRPTTACRTAGRARCATPTRSSNDVGALAVGHRRTGATTVRARRSARS